MESAADLNEFLGPLNHSGDLAIAGHLFFWCRLLTSSSQKLYFAKLYQIWYITSVGKETRNCKFHDPQSLREIIMGLRGKFKYFLKNILLYFRT